MAPRTRSSNANNDSSSNDAKDGTDSPSGTPRKVPHCTKCKRPRAGHPRTGCPFVDSPTPATPPNNPPRRKATESAPTTPGRRTLAPNNLADALGSMHIRGSPLETEEDMKTTLRSRRRSRPIGLQASGSLRSLSSSSNDIVEMLLQPGVLDDDTEPEDNAGSASRFTVKGRKGRIIRWDETIQTPLALNMKLAGAAALKAPKASPQSPMPGTLYTPNPSFFESQDPIPIVKQEEKPGILSASATPNAPYGSFQESFVSLPALHKPKGLTRSMSAEQRDFFISQLGSSSKATIHVLPKATVEEIAEEARDMGFLADIVMNDDEEDSQALLVVGRTDTEVDKLLSRVQHVGQDKLQGHAESEKTPAASSTSGESRSRLKAVAGGAVVGAVGAWAGLAFS